MLEFLQKFFFEMKVTNVIFFLLLLSFFFKNSCLQALVSHILATRSLPESDLRTRKHGMGKGLMTVWRATCPSSQELPTGVNYTDRSASWKPLRSTASRRAPSSHASKQLQQRESRMVNGLFSGYDFQPWH